MNCWFGDPRKSVSLLTRVAREKALPFEPLIPNETTIAAMREARAGNLPRANTLDELLAELNADD